jgi:hypothetical protein
MHVMTDDNSDPPRRRKASADAMAGREAAALVRELNRQMGSWQASSVKIHTIAERLKATGRSDPAIAEEAHTLFHVVIAESQRFEGLLPDQQIAVAEHGRIKDTRRSFEMVTDRLRSSLLLLGVDTNPN